MWETLKKNELKPHLRKCWAIPPEKDGEFVAAMEDVLEVYQREHDPRCPLVGLDEQPIQLLRETRIPIPSEPGEPCLVDILKQAYEDGHQVEAVMGSAQGWSEP